MASEPKYFISSMVNVFKYSLDGIALDNSDNAKNCHTEKMLEIDHDIEKKVKIIIDKLKTSHQKFEDRDFGPNDEDEYGAKSLYNNATPVGYPAPEVLKWSRPSYDDDHFTANAESSSNNENSNSDEEDEFSDEFGISSDDGNEVFCKHGRLFVDGSSAGDVIQGQLGDCWFLSALAVLGTNEKLLRECFWKLDSFKEYGLYVCRFYKDCSIIYVIIDDRIPVKAKDGKVVFAQCKDPNELWVPLIEKAYAKLHGSYKALISGYSHYALSDLTGYSPRLIVMKPGHIGYSDSYENAEEKNALWLTLQRYLSWGCLMGSSIQSNPKEQTKVEQDAGGGLFFGHAYSILNAGEIEFNGQKIRLIRLRNPWGRGEWDGDYSDSSTKWENADFKELVKQKFKYTPYHTDSNIENEIQEKNDGTFFMSFEDWISKFTSVFVGVTFPSGWFGMKKVDVWNGETGGSRSMSTWFSNPKIRFNLSTADKTDKSFKQVFIGLSIKDTRLSLGVDYYKDPLYATALAFDVITVEKFKELEKSHKKAFDIEEIPESAVIRYDDNLKVRMDYKDSTTKIEAKRTSYTFGTTQCELLLKANTEYIIVPSLCKRGQPGTYIINVFADCKFDLEGGINVMNTIQANTTFVNTIQMSKIVETVSTGDEEKVAPLSLTQYYEKKEQLRERMVNECKRLKLTGLSLGTAFAGFKELQLQKFKRRIIDLGFSLADFPDEDLKLLSQVPANSQLEKVSEELLTVSIDDFISFVSDGIEPKDFPLAPPPPPVDDILYKAVDLEGDVTVKLISGRDLRKVSTWFSQGQESSAMLRPLFKYDYSAALDYTRKYYTTAHLKSQKSIDQPTSTTLIDKNSTNQNDPSNKPFKDDSGNSVTSNMKSVSARINDNDVGKKRDNNLKSFKKQSAEKKASDDGVMNVALEQNTVLRRHSSINTHKTKRNIFDDNDAISLLNMKYLKNLIKPTNKLDKFTVASDKLSLEQNNIGEIADKSTDSSSACYADLWDFLVDCVVTISSSRTSNNKGSVIMDPDKSKLPEPAALTNTKVSVGSVPTPRNIRKTPGTASVTTNQNISKTKAIISSELEDKIAQEAINDNENSYKEVYRRVVLVPRISRAEIDGEKINNNSCLSNSDVGGILSVLFNKFDINQDGVICIDEFRQALRDINIETSDEESQTLFNRFETRVKDGNIDIYEFFNFFSDKQIQNKLVDDADSKELATIVDKVKSILNLNRDKVEKVNVFFSEFDGSQSAKNVLTLQSLNIDINVTEMARIERVFKKDVTVFMAHIFSEVSTLQDVFNDYKLKMLTYLERRVGISFNAGNGVKDASAALNKLWLTITSALHNPVSFEEAALFFERTFADVIVEKGKSVGSTDSINTSTCTSPRSIKVTSPDSEKSISYEFEGISGSLLGRLLADKLISSIWNRSGTSTSTAQVTSLPTHLHLSGFESFVRNNHVDAIERKFRYIIQSQLNSYAGAIYLLLRVYLSKTNVKIVGYDPVSGSSYSMIIREESQLPSDVKSYLVNAGAPPVTYLPYLPPRNRYPDGICPKPNVYDDGSPLFYNIWTTPVEETVMTDVVNRLRLVHGKGESSLMLVEDSKFVSQIVELIQSCPNLPFFTVVNDFNVQFSVDANVLKSSKKSITGLVFHSIRENKKLHAFFINTLSTMKVIILSYNSGIRITMSWEEMVSYLCDYRNPFATVQLLPKYLDPKSYIYQPNKDIESFGEDVDTENLVATSPIDIDGGTHPAWNHKMKLRFKPPLISSCRILTTEIAKIKINSVDKYVIVLVREGKLKIEKNGAKSVNDSKNEKRESSLFRFLTLYDPRCATEYQCGVANDPDDKDSFYALYYYQLDNSTLAPMEEFTAKLSNAIEKNKLVLGPAITPRLVLSVFNQRKGFIEELGMAQVPISSIISGADSMEQWVTLTYSSDFKGDGQFVDIRAGEVKIELSYHSKESQEAEALSKLKRENRLTKALKDSDEHILHNLSPRQNNDDVTPLKNDVTPPSINEDETFKHLKNDMEVVKKEKQQLKEHVESLEQESKRLISELVRFGANQDVKDIHNIAQVFLNRYKNKENGPLEPFVRVLQSYASADNLITFQAFKNSCEDLLIDVKHEYLAVIFDKLDNKVGNKSDSIDISAVINAFRDAFKNIQYTENPLRKDILPSKNTTTLNSSSTVSTEEKNSSSSSLDDDKIIKTKNKIETPDDKPIEKPIEKPVVKAVEKPVVKAVEKPVAKPVEKSMEKPVVEVEIPVAKVSLVEVPVTEDKKVSISLENSKSADHSVHKPPKVVGDKNGNLPSVTETYAISESKTVQLPAVPRVVSESNETIKTTHKHGAKHNTMPLPYPPTPASPSKGENVDWNSIPLPPNWDRCVDPATNRVYYADHVNKTTQWKHPLDWKGQKKKQDS